MWGEGIVLISLDLPQVHRFSLHMSYLLLNYILLSVNLSVSLRSLF